MQLMYASRILAKEGPDFAWDEMKDVARRWAWRTTEPPSGSFNDSGNDTVGGRDLRWSTIQVSDTSQRSWRLEVSNPPSSAGFRYQATVTVTQSAFKTSMFVTVGRQADQERLAPAPIGEFRRPRIVKDILDNIDCYAGSQPLRAEAQLVRTAGVEDLIRVLRDPNRLLPVVVVSKIDSTSHLASEIADATCGLAHVVVLDGWLALDRLQTELPEARLPWGGVRLFWPLFGSDDDRWTHRWWSPTNINELREDFPTHLFHMLARLSVLALGRDEAAESVREAVRAAERLGHERRLQEAQSVGDLQGVIEELQSALDNEQEYVYSLLEENERLERDVASLQPYKENFENLILEWSKSAPNLDEITGEEQLPTPSGEDFTHLWGSLEDQSDGAIIFTNNARDSWQRCDYPYPDKMQEVLIKLTQAAVTWRQLEGRLGRRLADWMSETVGLNLATGDEAMERLKIDKFEFEGRGSSRLLHVKLDDHVSPDRVGRIYFGVDQEEKRWIVDHVGLKLHGITRS